MDNRKVAKELLAVAKDLIATKLELQHLMDKYCRVVKDSLKTHTENDGIGYTEFWGRPGYDEGRDYLVVEGEVEFECKIPFDEFVGTIDFEYVAEDQGFPNINDYLNARKHNGKLDAARLLKDIDGYTFDRRYLYDLLDVVKFFHRDNPDSDEFRLDLGDPPDWKVAFDGKTLTISGSFTFSPRS